MANGVDERVKLAAALAKQDFESKEKLQNMFDQIANQETVDDSAYEGFEPMKTIEEEIGEKLYRTLRKKFYNEVDVEDVFFELFESMDDEFEEIMVDQDTSVQIKKQTDSMQVVKQHTSAKKGSILSSGAALAGLFF